MRVYLELAAVMIVWGIALYVGFFVLGVPQDVYHKIVALLLSLVIGISLSISQTKRGL